MASDLRDKFENYLVLNRLSPRTQESYLKAVEKLACFHHQSPDKLSDDQIQQYLLHLIRERKLKWSSCNVAFSGLHCFYAKFLKRPKSQFSIPPRPRQTKLPEILSPKEVIGLIHACKDARQRAMLMLTYGSGLRVSEVVRLKPIHLETDRMMVRVEQAKGRKDRYTLLSQKALEELRVYWRYYKPEHWLFYGRDKKQHISTATAQKIYYRAKETAKISRGKGIHTLRHCFATHLLEEGIDIYLIKKFLGHKSIETTMIYLHVVPSRMKDVQSPLDDLLAEKGTMP